MILQIKIITVKSFCDTQYRLMTMVSELLGNVLTTIITLVNTLFILFYFYKLVRVRYDCYVRVSRSIKNKIIVRVILF